MSTTCRVNAKSICATRKTTTTTRTTTSALFSACFATHDVYRSDSGPCRGEGQGGCLRGGKRKQYRVWGVEATNVSIFSASFAENIGHYALNQFHTFIFDTFDTHTETFAVVVDDETHIESWTLFRSPYFRPKRDKFARVHFAFNMWQSRDTVTNDQPSLALFLPVRRVGFAACLTCCTSSHTWFNRNSTLQCHFSTEATWIGSKPLLKCSLHCWRFRHSVFSVFVCESENAPLCDVVCEYGSNRIHVADSA